MMRATSKARNKVGNGKLHKEVVRAVTRERDLGLIESLFTTITRDELQLTVILLTN